MKRASRIYGSERSYILVNGSTCGILAAVFDLLVKSSDHSILHSLVRRAAVLEERRVVEILDLLCHVAEAEGDIRFD